MFVLLIVGLLGGNAMASDSPKAALLEDHLLYSAKSEEEIFSWAKAKSKLSPIERFDYVRAERFDVDGKKLLVVLAARPRATRRLQIFVYVSLVDEWNLLMVRFTNTADVKITEDRTAKELVFRSKAGKVLLILPIENVDLANDAKEM
jgi:hypothetical protein